MKLKNRTYVKGIALVLTLMLALAPCLGSLSVYAAVADTESAAVAAALNEDNDGQNVEESADATEPPAEPEQPKAEEPAKPTKQKVASAPQEPAATNSSSLKDEKNGSEASEPLEHKYTIKYMAGNEEICQSDAGVAEHGTEVPALSEIKVGDKTYHPVGKTTETVTKDSQEIIFRYEEVKSEEQTFTVKYEVEGLPEDVNFKLPKLKQYAPGTIVDIPKLEIEGYRYTWCLDPAETIIDNATFKMPNQDVTITITYEAKPQSGQASFTTYYCCEPIKTGYTGKWEAYQEVQSVSTSGDIGTRMDSYVNGKSWSHPGFEFAEHDKFCHSSGACTPQSESQITPPKCAQGDNGQCSYIKSDNSSKGYYYYNRKSFEVTYEYLDPTNAEKTITENDGEHRFEATVAVKKAPMAPEGKRFTGWILKGEENGSSVSSSFKMPAKSVTFVAMYEDLPEEQTFAVKYEVEGLPEDVSFDIPETGQYAPGTMVTVDIAKLEIEGYTYTWSLDPAETIIDNATFKMPNQDVTITITYEAKPQSGQASFTTYYCCEPIKTGYTGKWEAYQEVQSVSTSGDIGTRMDSYVNGKSWSHPGFEFAEHDKFCHSSGPCEPQSEPQIAPPIAIQHNTAST